MRRFSWFVLVKCVDYPIRMRHFSSRAIALGANFANKEIGRFTKSGSSMEEEKHKKPLLSYEEVIEVIDERISRDEPATCLLYTSPSPRDGLLSRMPSSA